MPDFILYAQHGWADNNLGVAKLAKSLATPQTLIISPNLGWVNTWLKMQPLIKKVEILAIANFNQYPETPIRIIGHSMGALIWLEILNQHPQWWQNVTSFVLIGAPVGGANLGKILDPFNIAVGGDLGRSRIKIAEAIALKLKTLSIAGDINGIGDGTISIASTKFRYCQLKTIKGVNHPQLRSHPLVKAAIQEFWASLEES
jgi:pimeloyl-ACP methyl ester carboxylesterase